MKRGDIVVVSPPGAYGKPRPAIVVQSDALDGADSVLLALLTSTLRDVPLFRLTLVPDSRNALKEVSQVMVDKILTVPRNKCGAIIGQIDTASLVSLNRMLSFVFGLAD
ncbi:MAG: type II toxin-antitoxin system PemK/MazF family toxin [Beijerinckiaceae bacterium]